MHRESLFVDTAEIPWRPSPYDGVTWKKLHFGPDGSAVLLHFDPGASYGAHRHPAGEEYLVLDGNLQDGERLYGPGTYVRHPAGSVHKPSSPDGCTVYVTLPEPIEDLEGS